jgi:hypothetical protein
VADTLAEERRQAEAVLREGLAMLERRELLLERLDALERAAKADLEGVVSEALLSATRSSSGTEHAGERIRATLLEALERWATRHDARLEAVAQEFQVEMAAQARRPGFEELREFFRVPGEEPDRPRERSSRKPYVDKIGGTVRAAMKQLHEHQLGMSLETARRELEGLRKMEAGALAEYYKKRKGLLSDQHAEQARRYVAQHAALDLAVPVLLELGALVVEARAEAAERQARQKRREELRSHLERSAGALAQAYFDGDDARGIVGWRARVDALRASVRDATEIHAMASRSAEAAVATLAAAPPR